MQTLREILIPLLDGSYRRGPNLALAHAPPLKRMAVHVASWLCMAVQALILEKHSLGAYLAGKACSRWLSSHATMCLFLRTVRW